MSRRASRLSHSGETARDAASREQLATPFPLSSLRRPPRGNGGGAPVPPTRNVTPSRASGALFPLAHDPARHLDVSHD